MATNPIGNSVVKCISMTSKMHKAARDRARKLGFRNFSTYVQALLKEDLGRGKELTLRENSEEQS